MNWIADRRVRAGLLAGMLGALGAAPAAAEPLEKLASKLEKGLKDNDNRKIAVLSFPYHDGKMSSGSSLVQERLTTYLAASGKLQVIERKLLETVLSEMKLGATGLLDEKTTAEVGRILGVAALVTGTLHDLGKDKTEVNARLIETGSGRILAARMTRIERSWNDKPVAVLPPDTADPVAPPDPGPGGRAQVQLALLLDTSNSMDGLIEQAKSQLWKIVNELASARREGRSPAVEVALYEYGNSGLSAMSGYIRQVVPFTTDLDRLSEQLFALRTNGGSEHAGQVIQTAVDGLSWTGGNDTYRAIFIAGNEPFTQGPVDFREAVASAKARGVFVNTIFCGDSQQGVGQRWEEGARLAGGRYMSIDQDRQVAVLRAPQDDEIERLGRRINDTYVPMAAPKARAAAARQESQDQAANRLASAGSMVQRSLYKAADQYSSAAAEWDVASAVAGGKADVLSNEAALPQEMREMSAGERKEHVEKKLAERKKIQERIGELRTERERWLQKKQAERAGEGGRTLDAAILDAVRAQARTKSFEFKN